MRPPVNSKYNESMSSGEFLPQPGLLEGGGLTTMSPYGPALGLLSSRPVDVAVGGFLFAGAVGMVLGPLGQSVLPTHTQKRVSRILTGGLLGSSVGWILGLFLNDTAFTDNDSLNVAPTFGVAGQLLGGIIAGLQKVEEE